jgi:uncharacterized membrane protein YebE (DUF533 family)
VSNRRILCVETTLNDPAQLLSLFLNGALGRSGRKRARKAANYISGHKGLISASGLIAAAGVAWGIYDSLKQAQPGAGPGPAGPFPSGVGTASPGSAAAPVPPPLPTSIPVEVQRLVRLAVSAARADGELTAPERAVILDHARRAGVAAEAELAIERPHPLAEIVRGVSDEAARHDLYALAFTIVRADEAITGGERIYLAQLAHHLGIDAATASRLELSTSTAIDAS